MSNVLFQDLASRKKAISVIGLGYVGLPLALALSRKYKVIAYDIDSSRVALMKAGIDPSQEIEVQEILDSDIYFTSIAEDLSKAHFHIIAVPTDVDRNKIPNLQPLKLASKEVGQYLKEGDCVVYESTVFPGCTEEECVPILEEMSGLKSGVDFKYGYSPERINPGDKEKTLTKILKIVSGCDEEALDLISSIYKSIIEAGVYETSSIKVAEAAKVIENTQRDINISLMNELALIFDKMGIDTNEVIEAAGTKWNFLKFRPGLVGGHCISVDPFYLIYKAKQLGHDPQVIAAGRRINDHIPAFIAKRLVQSLIERGKNPGSCKVLLMGLTFKEDISDVRNSKVFDLIEELKGYSLRVHIMDPYAKSIEVSKYCKIPMIEKPQKHYDAVVVAVNHLPYQELTEQYFQNLLTPDGMLFDLKGIYKSQSWKTDVWRL